MAAQLTVRAGAADAVLMRRIFGVDGSVAASYRPAQLVVDAQVVAGTDLGTTARTAGVPFLVDPLTHYLQDAQHPGHPWTRLPFGASAPAFPSDVMRTARAQQLVEDVIDFQLSHGATKIIAPYVHIERPDSGWVGGQISLWRATRSALDARSESLPLIAIVAMGWRCMAGRTTASLGLLWDALRDLAPAEVALAASKSHEGTKPHERLVDMLILTRELSRSWPVTMWQQGLLGEAGVAAGAQGYECGIGWRERCDLNQAMALHRRPPATDSPRGPRPVYVPAFGRSVQKATIATIRQHPALWRSIICADPTCCPPGGVSLLADARRHAVVSRARELAVLGAATTPAWAWGRLADKSEHGLKLAERVNRVAPNKVQTGPLSAVHLVASARRQTTGRLSRQTA